MKYKIISCAVAVLLMATPVVAQETSPIIVETGKPVPSIVRTGEPFKITYRATYTDVVLIAEEKMQFNDLLLVEDKKDKEAGVSIVAEVISLVIGEKFRVGSEDEGFFTVQDFTYTARIINEKKGNYKISPFNFIWVEKKAGTTVDEAKEKQELKEFPTDEIGIAYVSTIVKPPPLDIRDGMKFNGFKEIAYKWAYTAYGILGLCSLAALVILARFFRQPKTQKVGEQNSTQALDSQTTTEELSSALPRRTRREVARELKKLCRPPRILAMPSDLERKTAILLREFVTAELSQGPVRALASDTPNDLYSRLANLNKKQVREIGFRRHATFLELSKKLRSYYEDIESCDLANFKDPKAEIGNAIELIENLSAVKRMWKAIKEKC